MSKFDFLSGEFEETKWPEPKEPLTLAGFLLKCRTFNISMSIPMRIFCPSLKTSMKIGGADRTPEGIVFSPGDIQICRPSLMEVAFGTHSKEKLLGPTGRGVFILGWGKDDMVLEEVP